MTVKAATTIACRFVEAFGEPIVTPFAELNRLTPAPARVAAASVDDIARHGIVAARCRSIIALAEAQGSGDLRLDGGAHHNPDDSIRRLAELPGIGQWTAHYIAMRALRWPDAFPKEDIAVRNNLGGVTAKEAERCRKPGGPGGATRSCTSGACRRRSRRKCERETIATTAACQTYRRTRAFGSKMSPFLVASC